MSEQGEVISVNFAPQIPLRMVVHAGRGEALGESQDFHYSRDLQLPVNSCISASIEGSLQLADILLAIAKLSRKLEMELSGRRAQEMRSLDVNEGYAVRF